MGYYEGWASDRRCNDIWPEHIPLGVYSHINFAFATIDPSTFEVRPASTKDVSLFSRLTALKRQDPDVQVFIAIGGWSFNDAGPTATTFSDLAASEKNQKAFFKSLVSFLATYDFDGVDLDWEYPVAPDRSGRPMDFDNFSKFMSNLKNALEGTGGRDGLSITLPASYWYLQHFDIKNLAKHVDFFNIMSYDMHGAWDKGNVWTGEFLNAHTNLTEIRTALDLLWRNDIEPEMVVLGIAFYGRVFTAESMSCMEPGCKFASAGRPGNCSQEIGFLLNSELVDIIDVKNLSPALYEKAAVKVISWDNQWVAYDDPDTFKLKTDFARSQCLGGVMVWAVSHDTEDGMFSRELAKVTNRRVITLPSSDDSPTEEIATSHDQCKWTNCREDCPSGWHLMQRMDPGAGDEEWVFDETGCDGAGYHRFCCPPYETLPECGWYTPKARTHRGAERASTAAFRFHQCGRPWGVSKCANPFRAVRRVSPGTVFV